MTKRFTIEKKLVAVVRYFETMYVIRDKDGTRLYTGTDEKRAREIKTILNAYYVKKKRTKKPVKRKKRK